MIRCDDPLLNSPVASTASGSGKSYPPFHTQPDDLAVP